MLLYKIKFVLLLIFFLLENTSISIAQQNNDVRSSLENYNFSEKDVKRFRLSKKLNEISGLTITNDYRLFAHNDETGTIFEIDNEDGKIVNQYYLGAGKLKRDFEGIATVNDSLFLVTSSGVLYKFKIPDDEQNVEYTKIKTFISSKYNVEGLCYDEATNSLLLACKEYAGKNLSDYKAIYSFDLYNNKLNTNPRFLINLDSLKSKFKIKKFTPTGIEVHPNSGNIFILSSHEKAIVELSSTGELLNAVKLKSKNHRQPEGITFLNDLSLVISDEANNKDAVLTTLHFQK